MKTAIHTLPSRFARSLRSLAHPPSEQSSDEPALVTLAQTSRVLRPSAEFIARHRYRKWLAQKIECDCSFSGSALDRLDLLVGELDIAGGDVLLDVLDARRAGDREHHG
jgi:hypothetical protein